MENQPPLIVHWDTYPLDRTEPVKLFEHSRFNYMYHQQEAGVLMGYWEVENGSEVAQDEFDLDPFHELIVVLEGKLYASGDGFEEQAAGPGDVVMILPNRKTRLRVEEKTRALFVVYGTDPHDMIRRMSK
jgi:ethanolamine utilization protein EutQ (cupin superfamily)